MEGHELLNKMGQVRAPEGFEERVMSRLPAAREERARRARRATARYAFAGSAALLFVVVLVFHPGRVAEKPTGLSFAERQALTANPGSGSSQGPSLERNVAMPVYETMDYASEFRNAQPRPQPVTVYILEQVSEIPSPGVVY
jgi:hypothetical protein